MKRRGDDSLGMGAPITRRDFLNGVALAVGASLVPARRVRGLDLESYAPERAAGYYPPALTGLRGSHPGAFEAAHEIKDGFFEMPEAASTGEVYDLVVVGGGISGLSTAHFFRKAAGKDARVLVLDNHDDFGGHAKRNEFDPGRTIIGYGGTQSIDSPAPYSAVAKGLIEALGIEVSRWETVRVADAYDGLERATFFDKETFGADRLVKNPAGRPLADFLKESPLAEAVQKDILRLQLDKVDYMPGLTSAEKKAKLARMSYADFLTKVVKVDPGVLPFYQTRPHGLFGVGIDAVPAQDAWGLGLPGFEGMGLDPSFGPGMNRDAKRDKEAESYYFHFPDGNASVARLLVRSLVPAAIPGTTANDVVLARADYARLDEPASPVRIRLNSLAVQVRHIGPAKEAREVEVVYLRGGKPQTVRARACVLACWHTVIPYICPELPEEQRDALSYAVKVPLVYTNVVLREWTAFKKLGVSGVSAPGSFHTSMGLDFPVRFPGYQSFASPQEPIVVHMSKAPCRPGLPARDQHRAGREMLLDLKFEDFEREIRGQLARVLGPGGFDPARDVKAITVNRWPHGYAYQYNSLFDPFWLEGKETPCERARKPWGRIAFANADADAYSYTDAAIDQAHRAVQEVLALSRVS
jgi:spermidine dehydrogenase